MSLTVAVQMDPLAAIRPGSDSTLALMIEAARRGHDLWYYAPSSLAYAEGEIVATVHPVQVREGLTDFYTLQDARRVALKQADVILMRQDPPFDMAYITSAHMLERLHPKPLVVNNPAEVRNNPEKLFPLDFAQYMPPTLITADAEEIRAFHRRHGSVVLKPLFGYGGKSVFLIDEAGGNLEALLETLFQHSREALVVQKFLPEVESEDRRVILIDGEVAGVFGRQPSGGDIRANLRVGGTAVPAELTPRQKEICDAVGPVLRSKGLILTGLDLIGGWLTEINITSPTGLRALRTLYGISPESLFWDAVESRLASGSA